MGLSTAIISMMLYYGFLLIYRHVLMVRELDSWSKCCEFESRAGRNCRWGEWINSALATLNTTTKVPTEPPTIPRAPQHKLLPTAPGVCSLLCVCTFCTTFLSMGQHTWSYHCHLSVYFFTKIAFNLSILSSHIILLQMQKLNVPNISVIHLVFMYLSVGGNRWSEISHTMFYLFQADIQNHPPAMLEHDLKRRLHSSP